MEKQTVHNFDPERKEVNIVNPTDHGFLTEGNGQAAV